MGLVPDRRAANVLLVEDEQVDLALTREGFRRVNHPIHLHYVATGEACLAFLKKEGNYARAPRPDLILLDLNMPVVDGVEVMKAILADDRLRTIPVVVLATADSEGSIRKMYALRCSSYIVKPIDAERFMQVIQMVGDYWFGVVTLPTEHPGMACQTAGESCTKSDRAENPFAAPDS